jgi:hypothetical protein
LKELWGRAELLTLLAVRGMLLIIFEGLIRWMKDEMFGYFLVIDWGE